MADTIAPTGVALETSLTEIYEATARGIAVLRIVNVDGANPADVTACNHVDASNSDAKTKILPVNVEVADGDGIEIKKAMDTGDVLEASASAAGDLVAYVDFFAEPA